MTTLELQLATYFDAVPEERPGFADVKVFDLMT